MRTRTHHRPSYVRLIDEDELDLDHIDDFDDFDDEYRWDRDTRRAEACAEEQRN